MGYNRAALAHPAAASLCFLLSERA